MSLDISPLLVNLQPIIYYLCVSRTPGRHATEILSYLSYLKCLDPTSTKSG